MRVVINSDITLSRWLRTKTGNDSVASNEDTAGKRRERVAAPLFSSGEIKWDCGPSARSRRSLGSVICSLTAGSCSRELHAAAAISLSILASFYDDAQNNAVSTHSNGSLAGSSRGTLHARETLFFSHWHRKNSRLSSHSSTQSDKRRWFLWGQLAQRERLFCHWLGSWVWIVAEKVAGVWNEDFFSNQFHWKLEHFASSYSVYHRTLTMEPKWSLQRLLNWRPSSAKASKETSQC